MAKSVFIPAGSVQQTPARVCVLGEPGVGKAQPLDAKVLTAYGWKRMGEIEVGDLLIDPCGGTTEVIGVYPQGVRPIYRIYFSDGASAECDEEHLWVVQSGRQRDLRHWAVKTTRELMAALQTSNPDYRLYIPLTKPCKFIGSELPLDPYLLGALLGNGGLTKNTPDISDTCPGVVEAVRGALPQGVYLKQKSSVTWYITTGQRGIAVPGRANFLGNINPVTRGLREMGLMGHRSTEKFIPDVYKWARIEDRIALLQGLLDTDGYISSGSPTIE